jgi:hypothetical protein
MITAQMIRALDNYSWLYNCIINMHCIHELIGVFMTTTQHNSKYEHWVRLAFWRKYLRIFIFPLGGTTDFGRRL